MTRKYRILYCSCLILICITMETACGRNIGITDETSDRTEEESEIKEDVLENELVREAFLKKIEENDMAFSYIGEAEFSSGKEISEALTEDNYQTFFHPANNFGMTYVGLTYCKVPDELKRGGFVEIYLPYGDKLMYLMDGRAVESTAHGISVYETIKMSRRNAKEIVDQAFQELLSEGVGIVKGFHYDTNYEEEYHMAYKVFYCYEDNRTQVRPTILYADDRQSGSYLYAKITYLPEQFDDEYPKLLKELSGIFGLELPQFGTN